MTLMIYAAAAALSFQAAQPPPSETVILSCSIARETYSPNMQPLGVVAQQRLFRLSRGSFQEWSTKENRFGSNLCNAYACSANSDRTEGTVGSASVTYTIGLDRKTGQGYWSSVGASGNAQTKGECHRASDPSSAAPRN